jgi:hypothetical protein
VSVEGYRNLQFAARKRLRSTVNDIYVGKSTSRLESRAMNRG